MDIATVTHSSGDLLEIGLRAVDDEVAALLDMKARLDHSFVQAVSLISKSPGRVVILGMGKSGLVGKKIAATFASTGTPSFFVHPGEAFHGDLGMIRSEDIALLISNSGETEEILRLLPFFRHQGNIIIGMIGRAGSTLAQHAHVALDIGVEREACPNDLAPTSSTTCTLVMGDALAIALTTIHNFQPNDFARFHPGGLLGRRLLSRVKDAMAKKSLPFVEENTPLLEVIHVMTNCRLGLALVQQGTTLKGIITDGDLRRAMESVGFSLSKTAHHIMNSKPQTISADEMLVVAEDRMRQSRIGCLVVTDENSVVIGVLQIFD
jgi:arabinose-5-phosphate isomerase